MRYPAFIFLFVFFLILAGCSNFVQKVDYLPVVESPEDAYPAPIIFSKYKLDLPIGADIGIESNGARLCGWPYTSVNRGALNKAFKKKILSGIFGNTLQAQGYDVVGAHNLLFDEELTDEILRTEYKISARITDIQIELCNKKKASFFGIPLGPSGVSGELFMTVNWVVYDSLRRIIAYETKTSGYTKRRTPNEEGLELMATEAFEMATHNLGTESAFHDLIFYGKKPEGMAKKKRFEDRPRQYDPLEKVMVKESALSQRLFPEHAETSRKAVVMIETGAKHGSGFFITQEGHIVTTSHVVGKARSVRIVTADREEKLIAEILRVDRTRDVALLRLREIPDDLKIVTLPFRTEWPGVSEPVYVIGTPKMTRLQDTITHGIVSAHRRNFSFAGTKQNFIQADVTTHEGNNGGPMVDRYGNIVGIVEGDLSAAGANIDLSLNMFIPISEALETLGIHVGEQEIGTPAAGTPQKITP